MALRPERVAGLPGSPIPATAEGGIMTRRLCQRAGRLCIFTEIIYSAPNVYLPFRERFILCARRIRRFEGGTPRGVSSEKIMIHFNLPIRRLVAGAILLATWGAITPRPSQGSGAPASDAGCYDAAGN